MSPVCAWLDAGGAIDAKDGWGYTLLASCAFGKELEGDPGARIIIEEEIALARNLRRESTYDAHARLKSVGAGAYASSWRVAFCVVVAAAAAARRHRCRSIIPRRAG